MIMIVVGLSSSSIIQLNICQISNIDREVADISIHISCLYSLFAAPLTLHADCAPGLGITVGGKQTRFAADFHIVPRVGTLDVNIH